MGCSQSKIENEEAVSRCKDRKNFMKQAVSARNAFAAGHVSYAVALKNTGAALSDFAGGEVFINPHHATSAPGPSTSVGVGEGPPPPPPIQNLPPPPPPMPDMPPQPLQRAVSMPEFAVSKNSKPGSEPSTIEEGDEEEEEEGEDEGRLRRRGRSKGGSVGGRIENSGGGGVVEPPPPPMPEDHHQHHHRVAPPPPMPVDSNSWDYFFNVENIPGGSLGDVEDDRKVFVEMPKRAPNVNVGNGNVNVNVNAEVGPRSSSERRVVEEKVAQEKVVMEKQPPLGPQGGSGRGLKKGKQIAGQGPSGGSGGGGGGGGGGEMKRRNVSLVQIFTDLDDFFLKASESAHEVAKMLEAARLHYHSNFADNRGHIDHSKRVMRVITWNRSFKGPGFPNAEDLTDDFDSEENETHATVLDKLLAWEKKLYDEVKAGEIMKFEYQRKVALLNKQKKRGNNPEALEKIMATVSHLHTRYIVDMQSMDSTVSEISRLRDQQLYPKLVALVDAMASMWDNMRGYHEKQLSIAVALKGVDIFLSTKETTEQHHSRTVQLYHIVLEWNAQFEKMVNHQKEYIRYLNSWLKLNLVPIESSLKEKVSSPPRAQNPPIQELLISWHDILEKLPDEHARSAIHNFGAVLHTIVQQQEDELKLRARVEDSIKDLDKKQRQYNKWLKEYTQKRVPSDDMEPSGEDGFPKDEIMVEKEFVVENAKKKLDEDKVVYQRECVHVREKTLTSLRTRLPELFRALSDFAGASSEMYSNLKAITVYQNRKHRETTA